MSGKGQIWSLLQAKKDSDSGESSSESDNKSYSSEDSEDERRKQQARRPEKKKGTRVGGGDDDDDKKVSRGGRVAPTTKASKNTDVDFESDESSDEDPTKVKELQIDLKKLKSALAETKEKNLAIESKFETLQFQLRQYQTTMGPLIEFSEDSSFKAANIGKVRQIACGYHHCIAVTENGEVYAWGRGSEGQLGLGDSKPRLTPTMLELPNVKRVYAGANQSFAITQNGNVFAWGDNSVGQLGVGDRLKKDSPTRIDAFSSIEITSLCVGKNHSVAVTSEGEVYTWGEGSESQLGHSEKMTLLVPKRIDPLSFHNVLSVNTTVDHTIAIVEESLPPSIEPSKDQFEGRLNFYSNELKLYEKKRDNFAKKLIENLRELRRKVDSLEREAKKSDKESSVVKAGCQGVTKAVLAAEQLLDYEQFKKLREEFNILKDQNAMIKLSAVVPEQNQISLNDELRRTEGDVDDDDSEIGSLDSADWNEILDQLKERDDLMREIQKVGATSKQGKQAASKLQTISNDIATKIKMTNGTGAGNDASSDMAKRIYELWKRLKSGEIEKVSIESDKGTVKDVFEQSNTIITGVIADLTKLYASQLEEDSPSVQSVLPAILKDSAEHMKKANAYAEGVIIHTMQKLEIYKQNAEKSKQGGGVLSLFGGST